MVRDHLVRKCKDRTYMISIYKYSLHYRTRWYVFHAVTTRDPLHITTIFEVKTTFLLLYST